MLQSPYSCLCEPRSKAAALVRDPLSYQPFASIPNCFLPSFVISSICQFAFLLSSASKLRSAADEYPSNAFLCNMTKIRNLDLSYNRISSLDGLPINCLKTLKILNLVRWASLSICLSEDCFIQCFSVFLSVGLSVCLLVGLACVNLFFSSLILVLFSETKSPPQISHFFTSVFNQNSITKTSFLTKICKISHSTGKSTLWLGQKFSWKLPRKKDNKIWQTYPSSDNG